MIFVSKDIRKEHRFVSIDSYYSKLLYHEHNVIIKRKPKIISNISWDLISLKELERYGVFDEDFR